MTLGVFTLRDAYTIFNDTGGRWQQVVARWMGTAVFFANYVCLPDSPAALAAAIGLREAAIRHEIIHGPIRRPGGLDRPSTGP
jgi:hypothetical protein